MRGNARMNGFMPTYLYETIPAAEGEVVEQFEIRQSMQDAPLTAHPENGKPIRRVILGGYGLMGVGSGGTAVGESAGGACGTGCGCN